jgi:eukaryotic-like serine/threonine-protein kinase
MSMSQVGSGLPRLLAERYELVEQLASGSLTSVWRGHDRVLGRDVVVKVLHPDLAADSGLRGSFHQEAINAARLTHPNIVALYDTGEQEGVNYIVMELVDGPTLRDVLTSQGPLPPAKAARLASEVVHALEYAHQAGVVHRNLKPANILFCDDGSVKVADFSIAKVATADDPGRTGELLAGGYFAPEAADGSQPDGRADVYGLGACLFEMLTGRSPTAVHRGNNGPLSPRAIRAGVPRELDAVVLKAMMPDPADRYPTAAAMGSALSRAAAWDGERGSLLVEPPVVPAPGGAAPPPSFLRHEGRWLGWTLAVVGLVAALVVIGVSLNSRGVINLPGTRQAPERTAPQSTTPRAGPINIVDARAFDPFGSPPKENDAHASRAIDHDPETSWETESYKRSPNLGGLKPGVGMVLDAGSPKQARQLELQLVNGGSDIEVYGSNSVSPNFDGWAANKLATRPDAPKDATIDFNGDASYRYYLVWFTRLPPAPGGDFQDGIAEASLRS